ncbi:MAG: hypothetical protein ABIU58_00540 [Ramlibacter sp.]
MESSTSGSATHTEGATRRRDKPARTRARLISAAAVSAVAISAVLAAVMARHAQAPVESAAIIPQQGPVPAKPVVKAPDATAMGAAPACANCGVVESVVAVQGVAHGERRTVGYLMQIRMDDGSLRRIEHSGAMAAGSRVVVDRGAVRALPAQG